MVVKNLKGLKYQELQKLAKNAGIRANQKIDKLIKALEEHYIESTATDNNPAHTTPNSTVGLKKTPLSNAVKKLATPNLKVRQSTPVGGSNTQHDSSKQSKKRRRTFELDEPSLSPALTPTLDAPVRSRVTRSSSRSNTPVENEPVAKRQRRNTYNKSETDSPDPAASPGTTNMIASIDANQDSAERKANLLSAINKKIQSKVAASPARASSQRSQIPRFMAYLASMKKGTEPQKPVTPGNKDWTKIHGKAFSKFDSLDVYLDKKQKRKDLLTGSDKRPNTANSNKGNSKIAKPVTEPFVPSITSVKNMSFNFGTTPSRQGSTFSKASKSSARSGNKLMSANRTTPFKFTGNKTAPNPTPASASKKNGFDLKASLARPLSWKPHAGKLQPLDFNTTGSLVPKTTAAAASTKTGFVMSRPTTKPAAVLSKTRPAHRPSRQAMATKARPTNVKDVRRVQQLDRRNNQKYIDMMRRRGLMA